MLKNLYLSNQKYLSLFLAATAYIIWGCSFMFIRIALQGASPEILLATRFLIALLLMQCLLFTGKVKISLRGKNIKGLLLLVILDPVLSFSFEVYGVFYTNATLAGAMMALHPII